MQLNSHLIKNPNFHQWFCPLQLEQCFGDSRWYQPHKILQEEELLATNTERLEKKSFFHFRLPPLELVLICLEIYFNLHSMYLEFRLIWYSLRSRDWMDNS